MGTRILAREKMPVGTPINYVIYDEPLETKLANNQHDRDLILDEHRRFTCQLPSLLNGDRTNTNVIVHPDTPLEHFPKKHRSALSSE